MCNTQPYKLSVGSYSASSLIRRPMYLAYALLYRPYPNSIQATVNRLTMLPVGLRHAADHLSEDENLVHLFLLNWLPRAIGLVV